MATSSDKGLPPPPRRRNWLSSMMLGLVILVCGGIIGAGITAHILWDRFLHGVRRPEAIGLRITQHLTEDLDLSEEQTEEIRGIIEKHHRAQRQIMREAHPRLRAELDSLRTEVEELLTPEQAERWNERIESLGSRWQKHNGPGSWGRHRPNWEDPESDPRQRPRPDESDEGGS